MMQEPSPMPELPEVEHVARELREHAIGAEIAGVDIYWPRAVAHPAPEVFAAEITGRSIAGISRRGKLLLVELSGDGWLTIHRRMSGNVRLLESDDPEEKYLIAQFRLAVGRRVQYSDPRK